MNLAHTLKKVPFIAQFNAQFKAWKMKSDVAHLERKFKAQLKDANLIYDSAEIPRLFRKKLRQREMALEQILNKPRPRMLFLGSYEPQDKSGMWQGLHEVFEVVDLKNSLGGYGQLFAAQHRLGAKEAIQLNSDSILGAYSEALKSGPVDIVFGQMWSDFMDIRVLEEIRRGNSIIINVAMDDRGVPALWETREGREMGAFGLASACDLVLNTSPECCERYLLKGCPSLFFPLASDSKIFKPEPTKDIDVSFVGANYGIRSELIQSIQRSGVNVQAYGPGFESGTIDSMKMAQIFNRSKIILGVGTCGYTRDLVTMKLRDFDSTMAGALYLTTRNQDLYPLFEEGKEIIFYDSIRDAVEKINYYLSHASEREQIAQAGMFRAKKDHEWSHRLRQTFAQLGFSQMQEGGGKS